MTRKTLPALLACIVLAIAAWWFWPDSVLRPSVAIRQAILRRTPIGSTFAEVRKVAASKGWLDRNYDGSTGFATSSRAVVGVTSIRGNLGDLGPMNVTAYWGFDRNGQLVDVWVWRTFDAP